MEKLTYTHNDAAAKALASYYETPPLAYVRSYGCQQNVNDGEKIKGVLQDVGYGLCDTVEQADLILFNTCAVREHAEQRVFGNVGALKKLKEENPRLMIGICGCMAQQEHIVEKLRQSYPYVDLVFGVDGIDRLPAMLAERIRKGMREIYLYSLVVMVVTVLLMQVSAEWLVRMVSGSSEALVLENGARYLRWTSPFYAVLGVLLSTRYALQSLGEKVLPLFSSVIEFLGKVVFVLVFIPRFAYDAVILCEPVVWCFMALYLVAVYRCNPFVFPKKQ